MPTRAHQDNKASTIDENPEDPNLTAGPNPERDGAVADLPGQGGDQIGDTATFTDPTDELEQVEHARRRRRRRRWGIALGGVAVILIAAIVILNTVHVGYYMLAPGSVRRTEELVTIDGQPTFTQDAGSISYTTVSFSQASLWNKLTYRFDESVELVDEKDILRGQDPEQNRKENLDMMDNSKQEATVAALRKLGYNVEATGTGAVVKGFADNSPSKGTLEEGDAIVEIDGAKIATQEDLVKALADRKPNETATIIVAPDASDKRVTKTVTLGARPDDANRGFLGVQLGTRDLHFKFPFNVSIDSGQVGGPSAGLAFTLGVIDVLTPGSLTGGTKIATTGTIDLNGHVGPVGGVKQKTFAVRDSGATLFLVPPEEYDEAQKYAGPDLKVVKVETLDQALEVIAQNGGNTGPVNEKAAGH